MYKSSEKFSEYSGHQSLECRGCIAISYLHYLALKSAGYCRECHLADILWSYVYLLISFSHIQFGSEFSSHYIMMCNVLFFFGMYNIGIACFAAASTHHPAVV